MREFHQLKITLACRLLENLISKTFFEMIVNMNTQPENLHLPGASLHVVPNLKGSKMTYL